MIRSSALLTVAAMAMLVAGAATANLSLIYLSIAVSILAVSALAVGVLPRRREIFGTSGAAPEGVKPGWGAAKAARPTAGDRVLKNRGGRADGRQDDREQQPDPAARLQKATSGAGADPASRRWPGSIAAKGAPATARRGGGRPAGRGRPARSPSGREPAAREPAGREPAAREPRAREPGAREPGAREPARGDWAGRDKAARTGGGREPAGRGTAGRDATGREPVPTGSTGRGAGWLPPEGRVARPGSGPDGPAEPGRDLAGAGRNRQPGRPGRGREQAAARADRDQAVARTDRDQAAARTDRDQAAARTDREQQRPGRDRRDGDRAAAARADRDRDETAAAQRAEAFRLPPPGERARTRAEALGRAMAGEPAGDDFWDRVNEELAGSGGQDPAQPAWPASAGPRAMGTGEAAMPVPGEAGDEPEPARPPAGFRQAERPAWDRDAIPQPPAEPDEEQDRDERPGGEAAGPRRDRVVPRYVEDLAGGGGQREPEPEQAGADDRARADVPPGTDREPAEAGTPGPAASGGWSAWSGTRPAHAGDQVAADAGRGDVAWAAEAGSAGESAGPDSTGGERTSLPATAGAAAEAVAAADAGAYGAGASVQGDEAFGAEEAPGRAEPAGAAESSPGREAASGAERTGAADGPGETPGRTAQAKDAAEPGSARASAAGGATDESDTGAAGEGDRAAHGGADGSAPLDGQVAVVPGVPRYHRRGCILIRFLSDGDLETTSRREAEAAGLVPCKACQPDKPASTG